MSTGYSWAGIRQVRATLLGVGHVPERLCGFLLGALYQVLDLYLGVIVSQDLKRVKQCIAVLLCVCCKHGDW